MKYLGRIVSGIVSAAATICVYRYCGDLAAIAFLAFGEGVLNQRINEKDVD